MSKTTIEIPEDTKEKLRDARLKHETNYAQTIERLLGNSGGKAWTQEEIERIVDDRLQEQVRR